MNTNARKVSLFRNNRNQAVRIPKDLELPGDEAVLRKEGDKLILEPVATASLVGLLKSLQPLEEDLADIVDRPPEEVEL